MDDLPGADHQPDLAARALLHVGDDRLVGRGLRAIDRRVPLSPVAASAIAPCGPRVSAATPAATPIDPFPMN